MKEINPTKYDSLCMSRHFYDQIIHQRYSGFILLIKYPGCRREIGDFEPYTSGEFLNFPLIWKPVLHTDIMRDEKIDEILK